MGFPIDDALDTFSLDAEVFENRFLKWQLFFLRLFGFIFCRKDCLNIVHFLRGGAVSIISFALTGVQFMSVVALINDIERFNVAFGAFIVLLNISAKIFGFIWYRGNYIELLTSVSIGLQRVLSTSLPAKREIYRRYIKHINTTNYIILIPLTTMVSLVCAHGFYFLCFQYETWRLQNDSANATIILATVFQVFSLHSCFDNFFIAYIMPFYAAIFGIYSVFTWHTFNASLMRYAAFRLDILNYNIGNMMEYVKLSLHVKGSNSYEGKKRLLRGVFVNCVEDYAEIKRFVSSYEKMSNLVFFIESLTVSGLLCILLYVSSKDFLSGDGVYVIWCMETAGTLWLYYWHANEISYKSNNITNAIYSFPWYNSSLSLQKDFIVFMKMTMRPIVMNAGFIQMNTEAFVTILKTSYSYFTLLQHFTK